MFSFFWSQKSQFKFKLLFVGVLDIFALRRAFEMNQPFSVDAQKGLDLGQL